MANENVHTSTIELGGGTGEVKIADEVVAVIAGLAADGVTEIDNIVYIERGYEKIDEKFRGLGADIQRVYQPDTDSVAMSG